MTPPTIVVAEGLFTPEKLQAEADLGRARMIYGSLATPQDIRSVTKGADAIMVTLNRLPAESIEALGDGVKIIGRAGIGLDSIDLRAAERRGVAVFHTPDYCTTEVAVHAVAMILSLHRRLASSNHVARTDWNNWRSVGEVKPISEITVGVVGAGRIGREVIRLLAPFGPRIVAFDPFVTSMPAPAMGADSLLHLLAQSDVVTLHNPLTDDTRHLISGPELAAMRNGSMLVNVSRGQLIDESALVDALESRQLGGAALDVLVDEPPVRGSRILEAPNVMLSPHTAWYSTASEKRVFDQTVVGMVEYLAGRTPSVGRMAVLPSEA